MIIKPEDIKIEIIDPRPKDRRGGQQVGTIIYAIRVTHIPTGLTAQCGAKRSQHMNRIIAMEMLEYGLMSITK